MCDKLCLEKRILIIKNEDESLPLRRINQTVYEIGGDNSAFEFSGMQKGLQSKLAHSFDPDVCLFVNDSFAINGFFSIPCINDEIIQMIHKCNVFGGHICHLYTDSEYKGLELNPYIQTHFFIMTREIITRLASIVTEYESEKFINPYKEDSIFTDHEIWTQSLKRFMQIYLTQRWHGKGKKWSPETASFFKRKTLCVFNEVLLSARVKKLGYPIVDITPFSERCNSFYTMEIPFFRPIRPIQRLRQFLFDGMHKCFFNAFAENIGLRKRFETKCTDSVIKTLDKFYSKSDIH